VALLTQNLILLWHCSKPLKVKITLKKEIHVDVALIETHHDVVALFEIFAVAL
jgi:hypothetical protein